MLKTILNRPPLSFLASYYPFTFKRTNFILILPHVFLALVVGLIVFMISGCASSTSSHKTVVRFSYWGSQEEKQLIESRIKAFEDKHPNVDVVSLHIPDNYFQKLHILTAGGLMPDVVMVNSLYLPVYASSQKLLPLQSKVAKKAQGVFFEKSIQALSYKNNWYAFPRDISNLVVFINLDLLKSFQLSKPSHRWNQSDFLRLAQNFQAKAIQKKLSNTFAVSFFEKPIFWLPFVWSQGGDLFDKDFKHVELASKNAISGLMFYNDLRNRWHVAPHPKQIGSTGMSELFVQGKLLMFISGRWSVPFLREKATFNWDVYSLPKGQKGSVVGIDASGYAVSQETQHPELSVELAQFLTNSQSLSEFAQAGLIVPANQSVAKSKVFLAPNQLPKNSHVFIDTISTGYPTHTCAGWDELSEMLNMSLEPVFSGKSKVEEVVKKLSPELEKKLHETCP